MPTIKQLPVATSVAVTDLLPVSQGGTTRGLSIGGLLSSTQAAISLVPQKLLGRASLAAGGPEPISLGLGLAMSSGVVVATGADHASLPVAGGLVAGDEVVVNSGGVAKRLAAAALRALFTAGSGIAIDAGGAISASGPAAATAGSIGAVKPGAGLSVAGDGTLGVRFGGGAGTVAAGDDVRLVGAAPLGAGDLRRHGWVGDGRDETGVFMAALAALPFDGGEIVIPASASGTMIGAVTIDKSVTIRGEGGPSAQTQLRPADLTATMFTVTAPFVTIENLAIGPVYPTFFKQTAGSYIRVEASAARFRAVRLTLYEFHEGITIAGQVPTVTLTDIRGFLYSTGLSQSSAFIHLLGGVDVRIDGVTANGPGTGTADVLSGIWVENVGDCVLTNADVIAMGTDLLVNPGTGQVVTSLWVLDSFLDTASRGALFSPRGSGVIARCRLSNVWASSHTLDGIRVEGVVDGLDIDAPHALLNSGYGIALVGGTNIRVRGGQVAQNGGDGIVVLGGVSDWSIEGATVGATGGLSGNAGYGIHVAPGGSDRYQIVGNNVAGNAAGSVLDGGSGMHKMVLGNVGDENGYGVFRDAPTGYLAFSGRQAGFSGYLFRTDDGTEHVRISSAGVRINGNEAIHAGNVGSGLSWNGSALSVSVAGPAGPSGPQGVAGATGAAGPGPTSQQITSAIAPWFLTLPTTLPGATGQPWNNAGTLAFS